MTRCPGSHHYVEQAQLLNKAGHDVVVLDHQWAGLSSGGNQGGIDRGFGIARDVAAVVADVAARSPGQTIVVVGTSMGAGAGALGAVLMGDAGKIHLEFIHANQDTLARYETAAEWAGLLGDRARLTTVDSTSHVFEENLAEQGLLLDALKRLES